jgi:hypothetical protein
MSVKGKGFFCVSLGEISHGREKGPTGSEAVTEVASHEDGGRGKGHPGEGSFYV